MPSRAGQIKCYKDLRVWPEAMGLVVEVYRLAEEFPPEERFGLTAQVRDAVVTIPSNIAEGHGRATRKEYRHHVSIAEGSLAEVETNLELGVRLKYCTPARTSRVFQHCASLGKQLKSLRTALSRPAPPRIFSASSSPAPGPRSPIREPMHLDVVFLPCELDARPRPQRAAVVIDVIRATTSIVTAFRHGVRSVLPVASPEEARRTQVSVPGALLAGERGGQRLPGFDLGNSPRELTPEAVAHRDVVLTTSNGTKTLRAVGAGRVVAIGAFLNRAAVAQWLLRRAEDALIVCSGYEGIFSLEDSVCAGAVVERAATQPGVVTLGDGAKACQVLWTRYGSGLPDVLRETGWGRHIVTIGLGADLDLCAQLDATDVVPVMIGGRITL